MSLVLTAAVLCGLIVVPASARDAGYVTISAEKFTLGQGYLKEPVRVKLEEGDTVATVTARFLGEGNYKLTGSIDSSFYLVGIRDDSTDEIQIPSYILENGGISEEDIEGKSAEGWLGQYDYTRFAGWLFSVNHTFSSISASSIKLHSNDVIRWQFSVAGYGADLGNSDWASTANKDALTAKLAQINESPDVLSDSRVQKSYEQAMDVLCEMQSTQDEIDTALSDLTALVPDDEASELEPTGSPGDDIGDSAESVSLQEAINQAAEYLLSAVPNPQVGTVGGEWAVIGLARSGVSVPDGYFDVYYDNLVSTLKESDGVLDRAKYTEYSRAVLALAAIGKSPVNVGGYNLLEKLTDFDAVCRQGVNGPIYALLALDAKNYPIPESSAANPTSREKMISYILEKQLPDGGFDLADTSADPDLTAMAIQALSRYQKDEAVGQAIDRAVECLASLRTESGGYASWGTENVESAGQVLTALCALGIDAQQDDRFCGTDGTSILSYLMQNRTSDGAFLHTAGLGADQMATEQVFYSLVAYDRMKKGKSFLYDMTDVAISSGSTGTLGPDTEDKPQETPAPTAQPTSSPQPDETPAPSPEPTPTPTQKPDVGNPDKGIPFTDVTAHWAKDEITSLYEAGVVNGVSDNLFEPNRSMTRAEFASVMVKELNLEQSDSQGQLFEDVTDTDWYFVAVNTAAEHGLIQGDGTGVFLPEEPISRQETAVIIMRANGIEQGVEDDLDADVLLSPFSDALLCAPWSRDALAFSISQGLMVGSDGMLRPKDDVTRAELCVIVFRFLNMANIA